MTNSEKATNAGVHALTGFAFQRNCAIYFILDDYDSIKDLNYFVCIEHHDDLIFAYLDDDNTLEEVKAYQAKKSSKEWTTNSKLAEIIAKMTNVGKELSSDEYIKADSYQHSLTFLTNKIIKLSCGKRKLAEVIRVNEENVRTHFKELHQDIKDNLGNKMVEFSPSLSQLDNVDFMYVDITNTDGMQRELLTGKLASLFQGKITDPSAAMTVILSLFHNAETIYNQGNVAKLLDSSKRIYGSDISKAFNVITTRKKAYSFWRDNANKICEELRISARESRGYEEHINNAFDYFKDLNEIEFQRIIKFVECNRDIDDICISESDCILGLNKRYLENNQTQLSTEVVLFAIVAAFVETRDIG